MRRLGATSGFRKAGTRRCLLVRRRPAGGVRPAAGPRARRPWGASGWGREAGTRGAKGFRSSGPTTDGTSVPL